MIQAGHRSYHTVLQEREREVEESDRRSEINLRIYWYECALRYSASDCAHEHNVDRQIVALRAGNYYVAANNYSERRSRRKVQSVIRSLPRNAAMRSQHNVASLKRSFAIAIMGVRVKSA